MSRRRGARALAAMALGTLLGACSGSAGPLTLGAAKAPSQLSVYTDARFKGTLYVASGGRIWKLKGSSAHAVTPGDRNYAYPTASADGQHTAASLVGKGHAEIAVGGPDFADLVALTKAPADAHKASLDLKPRFSPDGRRLTFISDRSSCCSDEAVFEGAFLGPASFRPRRVTTPPDLSGGDDAPAYLADGSAIVLLEWRTNHSQLAEARTVGGVAKIVSTFTDEDILDPSPGPDGRLAEVRRKNGASDLWVSPAVDGDGGVQLTHFGDVRQAAWSADGSEIAFISNHSGTFDLWVVGAAGKGDPRRLTWGASLDAGSTPAWVGP
jgi:Tol biopolymer transport system component